MKVLISKSYLNPNYNKYYLVKFEYNYFYLNYIKKYLDIWRTKSQSTK